MATRRRIGVSAATTEAARRQLMQPVPCWEKIWVSLETAPTVKAPRWIKTDKIQQFSDDEGEVDEPLAPLPDEPEIIEGDEDMDMDENGAIAGQDTDAVEPASLGLNLKESQDLLSKPPSPKPQLSMSLQPSDALVVEEEQPDGLNIPLNPFDQTICVDVEEKLSPEEIMGLDISGLGGNENEFNVESLDEILGGPLMDQDSNPFESVES